MRPLIPTLALAALALAACGTVPTDLTADPSSGPTSAPAATRPAPAGAPQEGTLSVPREVKPGTYATTVPTDSFGCYWSRLKGTTGQLEDVLANGLGKAGARVTVTIKPTDKAFTSQGCGDWHRS